MQCTPIYPSGPQSHHIPQIDQIWPRYGHNINPALRLEMKDMKAADNVLPQERHRSKSVCAPSALAVDMAGVAA